MINVKAVNPRIGRAVLNCCMIGLTMLFFSHTSLAFPTYDGCESCHGGFPSVSPRYSSRHDGTEWGTSLMAGHMLLVESRCVACHKSGSMDEVYLNFSEDVNFSKSCVGCHGRDEDVTGNCTGLNGSLGGVEEQCGSGAGLRKYHESNVGAGTCTECHTADHMPVGEHVLPHNYKVESSSVKDACDADGTESRYGDTGLDNDGDGQRDAADTDCGASTFTINAGLNDAWVSADAQRQGLFFTVFEGLKAFFIAWFTFDSVIPAGGTAFFGANDHRWVTGLGIYEGNSVTINVELTSGGVFNTSDPLADQQPNYGTITIVFNNCSEAVLTYDFPSLGLSGQMTLNRVLDDNVELCETLAGD